MVSTGLRERKKQATRAALAEAAWSLVSLRGMDAVTVEDIARAADVSPRTFFNYFSSKEEAVVDRSSRSGEELLRALHERPADEPLEQAIEAALISAVRTTLSKIPREWFKRMRELREANPELIPHQLAKLERIERGLAEELAVRTGTDVDTDLYPAIAASSLIASWRVAWIRWSASETDRDMLDGINLALRQVMHGIAEPLRD